VPEKAFIPYRGLATLEQFRACCRDLKLFDTQVRGGAFDGRVDQWVKNPPKVYTPDQVEED